MAAREGAPQRAPLPRGAPAGLVHVERAGRPDPLEQILARVGERLSDARQDRVDRAGRDPGAEQLLAQLHDVATGDPVAHRQHRDRGVKARPERGSADAGGQPAARPRAAVRAAHPLAAVLGHDHMDRRQLLDLMARRLAIGHQLPVGEHVPAAALARPAIDDLVDRPRRQQRPALALVPGLRALLATGRILAAPRRRPRRILTRRLRRVPRRALRPALQLRDPLLLPGDPLAQRLDLRVHPQQHRDHDLATLLVDRLSLGPLHTTRFNAAALCPPTD